MYQQAGYLIVPELLDADTLALARKESVALCRGDRAEREADAVVPRGSRRALVNHYMSAESLLPWFPPGPDVPMAGCDHRDIMLVAGEDPYAYKGTTDVLHPHIRADGRGGRVR